MLPTLLLTAALSTTHAASPRWHLAPPGVVEGLPVDALLYRGALGEGRPMVRATVGDRDAFAIVDLLGEPTRIGADLARAAGLTPEVVKVRDAWEQRVVIPELQIPDAEGEGALVLRDVRARVVPGELLILGASTLGIGVAIVASEGEVRFSADGSALLAQLGDPRPVERQKLGRWLEHGEIRFGDGTSGRVSVDGATADPSAWTTGIEAHVRTDRSTSSVAPGILPELGTFDGVRRTALGVKLPPDLVLPPVLAVIDGALADDDPALVASLGYDALVAVDLAVADDQLAARVAESPTWHDPAPVVAAQLADRYARWAEGRAATSDRPPALAFEAEATSIPEGDPGSPADLDLHGQLAAAAWAIGDVELALQRTRDAADAAGDHCLPYLALGERRLRSSGERIGQELVGTLVVEPLERAATLYDTWAAVDPAIRIAIREGRAAPSGTFAIEQPDPCRAAWGRLMAAHLARGDLGAVEPIYEAHPDVDRSVPHLMGVALLGRDPVAAEARLREATNLGGAGDVALRLVLARAQIANGRRGPAAAFLARLPYLPYEHPLTAAAIAAELGAAPPPAVLPVPGVLAAHVVHAARGGEVPVDAFEGALQLAELRQPGDTSLLAIRAVWQAARGLPIPPPPGDHLADVWAAQALVARVVGDRAARDRALAELGLRYPELATGDLGLLDPPTSAAP